MEYAAIDEEDERTEQFIIDHPELLSEHRQASTLNHCINLQVEGKARQKKMARQYLLLTYVCDLAKTMPGRDAREAIRPLFKKMGQSKETSEAFAEHLGKYIAHVKTRAEVKKKELAEEAEGEAGVEYVPLKKGEQVGPGGLDPAEVFESLPRVLQEAFGERDIDALKTALQTLSAEDAEYHMKRCTDSGLWDPGGGGGAEDSPTSSPYKRRLRRWTTRNSSSAHASNRRACSSFGTRALLRKRRLRKRLAGNQVSSTGTRLQSANS